MAVRHEVLGVGPKHRLVLQNPGGDEQKRGYGQKKTDRQEKKSLG